MNLATLTPKPEMVKNTSTQRKKTVKKHKRRSNKRNKSGKKSSKKSSKKSGKKSGKKSSKKSSKKHHRSNPYEYNIQNQIDQFYEMTLKYLSSEQKGFLNVVNNSIVFNKGGKGTELYLKDLENMPWWTFKLSDIKQKLPIASPLLVGPLSFKMTFKQEDKNAEIKRFLSVQNGNLYLVKEHELNTAFL
jgi:hypothetical protein